MQGPLCCSLQHHLEQMLHRRVHISQQKEAANKPLFLSQHRLKQMLHRRVRIPQ